MKHQAKGPRNEAINVDAILRAANPIDPKSLPLPHPRGFPPVLMEEITMVTTQTPDSTTDLGEVTSMTPVRAPKSRRRTFWTPLAAAACVGAVGIGATMWLSEGPPATGPAAFQDAVTTTVAAASDGFAWTSTVMNKGKVLSTDTVRWDGKDMAVTNNSEAEAKPEAVQAIAIGNKEFYLYDPSEKKWHGPDEVPENELIAADFFESLKGVGTQFLSSAKLPDGSTAERYSIDIEVTDAILYLVGGYLATDAGGFYVGLENLGVKPTTEIWVDDANLIRRVVIMNDAISGESPSREGDTSFSGREAVTAGQIQLVMDVTKFGNVPDVTAPLSAEGGALQSDLIPSTQEIKTSPTLTALLKELELPVTPTGFVMLLEGRELTEEQKEKIKKGISELPDSALKSGLGLTVES
ncbi:MAG: hypothetical protein ACRCTR_08550 [Actinomycetota bacterium]